jgi:hypothetical protein
VKRKNEAINTKKKIKKKKIREEKMNLRKVKLEV